jgi:hypothetical protein
VATPDGAVWVLQDRRATTGGVYRFDDAGGRFYPSDEASFRGVPLPEGVTFGRVTAPDGTIFVLTAGSDADHLHRFADGAWKQIPTEGLDLSRSSADWVRRGMAAGPDGSVWATCQDGVVRFIPPG